MSEIRLSGPINEITELKQILEEGGAKVKYPAERLPNLGERVWEKSADMAISVTTVIVTVAATLQILDILRRWFKDHKNAKTKVYDKDCKEINLK